MKVILEIEYPNDKIFKADTLPIRIVDLNYGIYFDGKAKIVRAIPIEWLLNHLEVDNKVQNDIVYHLIDLWEKENEID